MRSYFQPSRVRPLVDTYGIAAYFSDISRIRMQVIEYEPGEYISSPNDSRQLFQFMLHGRMSIYYARDTGEVYSLAQGSGVYIIGDLELFYPAGDAVYSEAVSEVTCLAISLRDHREALLADLTFVTRMAEGLAEKLGRLTMLEAAPSTLEERALNYLRYRCPDHSFRGLEQTAFHLHCSARQLQRVMNHLVLQGRVQKTGKGSYRALF